MNKKKITGLATGLFLAGTIGIADATSINFDVDDIASSVLLTNLTTFGNTSLVASLVTGLDGTEFTLNDGEAYIFDFFTLTATGTLGIGSADITATLGFDTPSDLVGSGDGGVGWFTLGTFFGRISGGILKWDANTLPDLLTLPDGNTVSIDFESGVALIYGNTVTIHASVKNLGGGTSPVPEPANMLLLGSGLAGLAGLAHRKKLT